MGAPASPPTSAARGEAATTIPPLCHAGISQMGYGISSRPRRISRPRRWTCGVHRGRGAGISPAVLDSRPEVSQAMDTEKFKMGWLIVAFDLPVGTEGTAEDGARLPRMAEGRRLPDAPVERLCAGLCDLCPAGNACRSAEEKPAAGGQCAGDIRDACSMGKEFCPPRIPRRRGGGGGSSGADPTVVVAQSEPHYRSAQFALPVPPRLWIQGKA